MWFSILQLLFFMNSEITIQEFSLFSFVSITNLQSEFYFIPYNLWYYHPVTYKKPKQDLIWFKMYINLLDLNEKAL